MKIKQMFIALTLLAVIGAGCAPQETVPDRNLAETPTVLAAEATIQPIAETDAQPAADQPTPAPVATSRGDQLVATDPSTVNLTSGKPTLLEFFRFT